MVERQHGCDFQEPGVTIQASVLSNTADIGRVPYVSSSNRGHDQFIPKPYGS